jgi:hypothetical protein
LTNPRNEARDGTLSCGLWLKVAVAVAAVAVVATD